MGKFEGKTNRAQFSTVRGVPANRDLAALNGVKCGVRSGGLKCVRVYEGDGRRWRAGKLVVVQDDYVHPISFQPCDRIDTVRTAVDSEQQRGRSLFKAILDGLLAETVALIHPVW